MNYGDQFIDFLKSEGYTTVFYVAGGNIMHILNSSRSRLTCIPVVHEVSAVIAAEYFNESSSMEKAFALVTAGPGLTNCLTGIAGAWLESRNVLIVGGQVKVSDLKADLGVRQNGIQEIDGVQIVQSLCKIAARIDRPYFRSELGALISLGERGRPGPVFLEFCLDVQASPPIEIDSKLLGFPDTQSPPMSNIDLSCFWNLFDLSERPILLIGGGVSRTASTALLNFAEQFNLPVMTTWNGADRISSHHHLFVGRPNTWGQRSANVILQQSDLLIAVGTRLGLQQTGFNWQEFLPVGKVVQVDIDEAEIKKGHPNVTLGINTDCGIFSESIRKESKSRQYDFLPWLEFAMSVRQKLPLNEIHNSNHEGFLNPYTFVEKLSKLSSEDDVVIPCSSGGAFTTMMQAFQQKSNQKIITNKGLASMGYGLAGAIGASVSNRNSRVVLVEGDGGFAQNIQELGTVSQLKTNLKIFLYSNEGYASIRMTQKNYFQGDYMGCDIATGLGLPNWELIFSAFSIPCLKIAENFDVDESFLDLFNSKTPAAFIVPIHPEQTFFPKISSSVTANGQMSSDPLHKMTPPLSIQSSSEVFRYTS
jgi:acetolactate synthase I/II/III large subunit